MTLITVPLPNTDAELLYSELISAMQSGTSDGIIKQIESANLTDLPFVIRKFTNAQCEQFWALLCTQKPNLAADFLDYLTEPERALLFSNLPIDSAKDILLHMRSDVRRSLLRSLPKPLHKALESSLPETWENEEKAAMSFPNGSVGRICKNEIIKLESWATTSDLENVLREGEQSSERIEWRYIYLHDKRGNYLGTVKTRELFLAQSWDRLLDHIDTSVPTVPADFDLQSLKSVLDSTSHSTVPVINEHGFQIGIVGHTQLNQALYEKSEQQQREASGIFGGDEFRTMPLLQRNIRRLTFLLPSVILSYAAVSIIASFEHIIEQVAVLAAVLPLVANLSGAAGNQSVAVSIRELSTKHISAKDWLFVVAKELPIGAINGLAIGLVIALLMLVAHGQPSHLLPVLVAAAYTISSTLAVMIGGALPLILKRVNLDPAMLSSPLLTTLTDAISFFSVLYLAQLMLL
ncbi:magnesium transporter [Vibrio tapetis]|uniref:Putative magnesium transporter n=1 Tax=Vibrio tapetis subsp. tapetis TaxID=1671868 RepID=A0A2N8ZJG0_9VIBR|nr:magnesium transporter [Vibrio tapetis]SON52032.1 putative magnesium transporter [Vibrio tapetis subsp. tapetis]